MSEGHDLENLRASVAAAHRRLDEMGREFDRRLNRVEMTIEVTLGEIRARLDDLRTMPNEIADIRAELRALRKNGKSTGPDWSRWTIAAVGWLFALIALILSHLLTR